MAENISVYVVVGLLGFHWLGAERPVRMVRPPSRLETKVSVLLWGMTLRAIYTPSTHPATEDTTILMKTFSEALKPGIGEVPLRSSMALPGMRCGRLVSEKWNLPEETPRMVFSLVLKQTLNPIVSTCRIRRGIRTVLSPCGQGSLLMIGT